MDTNAIAQFYDKPRRLGVYHDACQQLGTLQRAVNDTVRGMRALLECGVDPAFLDEMLRGLHDTATNRAHAHAKDMDDAGYEPADIDLSEIDDLLAAVRP